MVDAAADTDVTVRRAVAQDLDAVRRLLATTWHATYDASLGVAKVEEITASWHSLERLAHDLDQQACFVVAERGGEIVGTASAHAGADGKVTLARLYVVPEAQGAGVGTKLLAAAVASCPAAGSISLEVERNNQRAIAFYERKGFEIVGSGTDCGGCGANVAHVIMRKELNPA